MGGRGLVEIDPTPMERVRQDRETRMRINMGGKGNRGNVNIWSVMHETARGAGKSYPSSPSQSGSKNNTHTFDECRETSLGY